MHDDVNRLIHHADVSIGKPSSPEAIEDLVQRYGAAIPESLLQVWRAGEGLILETLHAHIVGPSEARSMIDELGWGRMMPLLDDHESNYLVLALAPPIAPRIAYFPHDGEFRLIYRNLDGFWKDCLAAIEKRKTADLFFRQTRGDYDPSGPRTADDVAAAREMLATNGELQEWNIAIELLDQSCLAEWARLLETDHFIRRDALARLRQMDSLEIRELLAHDRQEFEAFRNLAIQVAREAGFQVGPSEDIGFELNSCWINLEAFYHLRNAPDAVQHMIKRWKRLASS